MKKGLWGTLDPFVEPSRDILGRNQANAEFLKALFQADPFESYHFFLSDEGSAAALRAFAQARRPELEKEKRLLISPRPALIKALRENSYHCFHLSDCINYPAYLAALRNQCSAEIFPITGTTHSLSYSRFAKEFLAHIWPGCTARDVVTATSRGAIKVLQSYYRQLKHNYGLMHMPQPGIAHIPLGVDPELFQPPSREKKEKIRAKMNLPPGSRAFLLFGRISVHSKMDLLPLLAACRRLFEQGLPRESLSVIMAGFSKGDDQEYLRGLKNVASNIGLDLRPLLNPSEEDKKELYQAADIFVSIADNVQETFGLVILEAAASGLPIIASDYNGYRDLVQNAGNGLLIPTTGPISSQEIDPLGNILFDNHLHLALAQETCVEVPALARAMQALIEDPHLAAGMGEHGRNMVLENYSWEQVIKQYLELWESLWLKPVQERETLRRMRHPLHLSYSELFSSYPSANLKERQNLIISKAGQAVYQRGEPLIIHAGLEAFIDQESIKTLLFLARKSAPASLLACRLAVMRDISLEQAQYHLLFCLKHDLLEEET